MLKFQENLKWIKSFDLTNKVRRHYVDGKPCGKHVKLSSDLRYKENKIDLGKGLRKIEIKCK